MDRPWVLSYETRNCTIEAALAVVGDRGSFMVLREAFNGVRRFDDMRRRTQAPRQVLSDRLSRLVADGMLRRVPYRERGQRVRHEYWRTKRGRDRYLVLVAWGEGGNKYAAGPAGPQVQLTHRDCGAGIQLQVACTDGHVLESPREVTPLPGPGARKIA